MSKILDELNELKSLSGLKKAQKAVEIMEAYEVYAYQMEITYAFDGFPFGGGNLTEEEEKKFKEDKEKLYNLIDDAFCQLDSEIGASSFATNVLAYYADHGYDYDETERAVNSGEAGL